jgi:hypothetical protein
MCTVSNFPISVAARFKTWDCLRPPLFGISVSNPAGNMVVSCECCVLSSGVLCDGKNPCPEEFCGVSVCS